MPEVVEIKGVGPVLAKACTENGYGSVEKIAAAAASELVTVPGVSDVRAKLFIAAAKTLLNGSSPAPVDAVAGGVIELESKRSKKEDSKKKKNGKARKLESKEKNKKNGKNKKRSKKSKKKNSKKK